MSGAPEAVAFPPGALPPSSEVGEWIDGLRRGYRSLASIPAARLEEVWNDTVAALTDPDGTEGRTLRERLAGSSGLSPAGLEAGLDVILAGVGPEVTREVFARAQPRDEPDVLLVVLAATPPGLVTQPLLPCLARRRPALFKSSSREPFFAPLLLACLAEREPRIAASFAAGSWSGGEDAIEPRITEAVDHIVAFGGERMLEGLGARHRSKLTVQGPRASVAVLGRDALGGGSERRELFAALARDVALFDQRGCLSLQVVFTDADVLEVGHGLAAALERLSLELPPGRLEEALLLRVHELRAEAVMQNDDVASLPPQAGTVIALRDAGRPLVPSPGARTVFVHPASPLTEVPARLRPWAGRLQGAVLAGRETEPLAHPLRELGVTRLARPGRLQCVDALWRNGGCDPLQLY